MIEKAIKGRKYRVVSDYDKFFETGEIVVALENGVLPYCVRESEYQEEKRIGEYSLYNECNMLCCFELEELESEESNDKN